jgi:serine/threonine protein kinase
VIVVYRYCSDTVLHSTHYRNSTHTTNTDTDHTHAVLYTAADYTFTFTSHCITLQQQLGQGGVVKLADFGTAANISDAAQYKLIGSPLFSAPEVLLRRYYSPKADIWSVGVSGSPLLLFSAFFSVLLLLLYSDLCMWL